MTSGEVCTKKTLEVQETQKKVTDAVMTSIDSTFAGHFHSAILKLPMELTDSETAQLQDEAWGQSAYNVARTLNCDDDRAYIRQNRNLMGKPSTLAIVNGKPCSTRALSASFALHREMNNKLVPLLDDGSSRSKKRKPDMRPNRVEFLNRKLPPVTPTAHTTPQNPATPQKTFSNPYLDLAPTCASKPNFADEDGYEAPASALNFARYPQFEDDEQTTPLHAYDRVMNHTASQIAHGTMSKLHMDVDAGTETMESVVDLEGTIAGRRMRYMVRNREIAELTCGVYGGLAVELGSQEIALMLDHTWGKEYSQEEEV
jgi:hypothetical protein